MHPDLHQVIGPERQMRGHHAVAVTMELTGQPTVRQLTLGLSDLEGVLEVTATDLAHSSD